MACYDFAQLPNIRNSIAQIRHPFAVLPQHKFVSLKHWKDVGECLAYRAIGEMMLDNQLILAISMISTTKFVIIIIKSFLINTSKNSMNKFVFNCI